MSDTVGLDGLFGIWLSRPDRQVKQVADQVEVVFVAGDEYLGPGLVDGLGSAPLGLEPIAGGHINPLQVELCVPALADELKPLANRPFEYHQLGLGLWRANGVA